MSAKQAPTSYGQRQLWFIDRLEGGSAEYNISRAFRLKGKLDREALQMAFNTIVERHESLRTHFAEVDGEPVQVIDAAGQTEVLFEDLSNLDQPEQQERIKNAIRQEAGQLLLQHGPLVKMRLLQLGPDDHILLRTMHHIVSDGWSQAIFSRELKALYDAYQEGRGNPLAPLAVQYRDFAVWQRSLFENGQVDTGRQYWRKQLAGIAELELPTDRMRPAVLSFESEICSAKLDSELVTELKRLSKTHKATLYMTLLAAFGGLLSRYSGQDDIVVGSPIANRQDLQLEGLIGFFVNSLAMRMSVTEGITFRDLLAQVRETVFDAYEYQDVPFEQIVKELSPRRNLNQTPVYQVMFGLQNVPPVATELNGVKVEPIEDTEAPVHFDLTVDATERDGEIWITWSGRRDLFDRWSIERMARHYVRLLQSVVANVDQALEQIDILTPEERRQALYEWNATQSEFPAIKSWREKLVHELFEEQVEKTPDAVAVVFEDAALTYRELNRRANQLAHHLRELGVGPDVPVGIYVARGLEMMVGLLSVMKAGGAYVPLDPAYPVERLRYMLEDSGTAVLLTQEDLAGSFNGIGSRMPVIDLASETQPWLDHSELNPERSLGGLGPEHVAYVIYTSGSTGKPKGVMATHAGLSNYLAYAVTTYVEAEVQGSVVSSPLSFDATVTTLLAPLLEGKTVELLPDDETTIGRLAERLFGGEEARLFKITPAHLDALEYVERSKAVGEAAHRVVVGGEQLTARTLQRTKRELLPAATFVNEYGPTETVVGCSVWMVSDASGLEILESQAAAPIGRAISNTQLYVLGRGLQLQPCNSVGELYIGGAGVARGYLNQAELTGERFIANPFGKAEGGRLYRTGDLVRRLPSGDLMFVGRRDHQVKIRGYRIELGEIEASLLDHEEVREAAVVALEEAEGERRLVAYYSVEGNGEGIGAEKLRQHLASRLPEHMVPAAYVCLQSLPLTPNGKLDRKALPAPESGAYVTRDYEEPVSETEKVLAAIWAEALKLERVGRHDNFFELGGHSLLILWIVSRLRKTLNVEVTIRDVFEHPVLADLAAAVQQATPATLPPITPARRVGPLPLSFAQQRLWFLAQMGASEAYHVYYGWRLKGQLDQGALRRALDRILARHEALRTTFTVIEGQPIQRIAAAEESRFHLVEHDLTGTPDAEPKLEQLVRAEAKGPFDLEAGPLIRGRLIRLDEEEHALLITMHHIVSDGWSMDVLIRELSALYGAFARGEEDPLAELEVQYADYAVWQRQWMEGEILRQQGEYWERTLAGAPTLLELPTDHPRPAEQDYAGGWVTVELDEELSRGLKELSKKRGMTLYMTLLAGWGALLARLSGQEEVVIGTPVANRGRMEIEGLIGFFLNRLALRLDVSGAPSVGEMLERVKEQTLLAQQHQDIPFEQVVELARPARSLAHSPLFQVVFDWQQNAGGGGLAMPGVELGPLGVASEVVAKHDLLLFMREAGEQIVGTLVYATALFERATVERYLGYLRTLLEGMVAEENQAIDQLRLLPEAERCQLLYEWNATEGAYPREQLVHELFEAQVEKTPDAVAVVFEDATLSYGELNRRANQLAHYLRELGVGPDQRVAICMERSLEMVVSLLGVLKAGGAYVPLDPAYPVERLRYMLDDSAPVAVLMQSQWQEVFSGLSEKLAVVNLDEGAWQDQPHVTLDPASGLSPEHLAYVIYTSGSTGLAKGVMVEHRQLTNYVSAISHKLGVEEGWSYGLVSTFAADLGHTVMYSSLLRGGVLHLLPTDETMDGEHFGRYCRERSIDCVKITPTHFQALLGEDGGAERIPAKCLVFGGEALWPELVTRVKSLRPGCRVYNHYGPTECTVGALSDEVVKDEEGQRAVALGRPLRNMRVYVLDGNGAPAPVGVVGELYIGGAGVARGYLNRAEVTAERFVSDPFAVDGADGPERMYKTGDLGRWKADGTIEFVGRNDFQVKLRGYRVELGEIEASLREHAGVREAVVLAREDTSGDKRLVAYYTRAEENGGGEGIEAEELRRHVAAKLPEYMAPAAYVYLEKLPLTANGKLDRKALPAPETETYGSRDYDEPVGEIERAVAEIWADVLKVERVGRHDNFFEVGGHSLMVIRVVSRLRKALKVDVTIREVFEHPVLAHLAAAVQQATPATLPPMTVVQRGERLPLSFAQQRLWFLAQIGGSAAYHIFYGWRLKGQLDQGALRRALDRIVARHEALRTTFIVIEGQPIQRIAAAHESWFHLVEHDLAGASDAEASLKHLVRDQATSEFDLEAGPLIRGRLIRLGEDEHALLITMHHIVSDGWSMGVFIRELSALYGAFARGEEDPLPELILQYADYAVWQRQWMEGEILRQQGEYWERTLAGAPTLLELPADHPRPAEQEYAGGWMRVELDEELSRGLKELSKRHGMTLYMTLLAGWGALLARLSGQEEVVIGAPVANRGRVEVEGLIGFFVNTLALRLDVSGSPSVGELLERVKEKVLAAQQHQDIPFEQVVEMARPVRSLSHSPLFQVMFEWQQNAGSGAGLAMPGVELGPLGAASDVVAQFDLMLFMREAGEQIDGGVIYATSLFERATVERYLAYLRTLLAGMVADESQAIDQLRLLPEVERRQVLYEWNATEAAYPREQPVHDLFEAQVEKTPDAAAVVFEDATLSYSELNRRANQLAHYLRELGVGPDQRVAICMERSLEMLVGLLGVLKAGGAYVPLDPAYPVERLRYMVADSAPAVLLTEGRWQELFPGLDEKLPVVEMDQATPLWSGRADSNPPWTSSGSRHLAYVIYTSGTTGTPKGVMVEQRGMVNHLFAKIRDLQLSERDVVAQTASQCFDISVWQFFAALVVGGQVQIVGQQEVHDPEALLRVLDHTGVTVWETVPSLLEAMVGDESEGSEKLAGLRWLVVTGEACPVGLCRRWRSLYPAIAMMNAYGPTECSDDVTHYALGPGWTGEELRQLPIGRPLMNTEVYVLDGEGEPAPVGVRGELYIGGEGVGRGYWKRPELTGDRFVADRFGRRAGARLYRTGDVGRWQADGTLEFLGRIDHQVKIRGYRIELGEIEARLIEHEAVQEAVVIEREDTAGDKRLVAYYSSAESNGAGIGAEELRRHLAATLPEYMTPAAYVRMAKLPLTPNGKVDRKALPAPETDSYAAREYEEPVGEIETAVAEIWADVLKVDRVGRHDNFFELGGHSLLVVRVIAGLRQVGLEVDVRTLFATPVLAQLAAEIVSKRILVEVPPNGIGPGCELITPEMLPLTQLRAAEIEQIVSQTPGGAANIQDIYPLAPLQEGILFHHLMEGESDPYIVGSLYSFDSRERLENYLDAMQAVIDRHDILRTGVLWEGLSEPVQVVWRKAVLPVEKLVLEAGDGVAQLREQYNPRSYRMDVRQAPMLRVAIAEDEEQGRWLMMLLRHHLMGDHTTLDVMQDEIEAYLLGRADSLPRPLPFRNLVAQARLGISREEHEAYFKQLLADVEEPTAPFGLMNVQGDGTGISQAYMRVEADLARRIRERARRLGVSAASLWHVAWAQVAARTTGREDVVFGTTLFGRMQGEEGIDRAVGLFMNTLPVRMRVGEQGAEESVRGAQRQLGELMRHEHASLALAQRCSAVPAPAPLFTSVFNYRYSAGGQERSEEKARAWEGIKGLYAESRNNYPLNLAVDDLGEGFRLATLTEATVDAHRVCEYMHRAMESLVEALEREPSRSLRELEVIPEAEKRQILYEWNATEAAYPREQLVHELFEEQLEKTPDAVAVVYEDATLSYGELNRRANQLAHYLRELGVGPDQRVAICMERSLEMVVSLLGVLKAGGAYVPLDPAYPVERLRYMLDDSAPVAVLTQSQWQEVFSGLSEQLAVVNLDDDVAWWQDQPQPPQIGVSPEHLAYVIYTSGSTGLAKGVMVEHRQLVNYVSAVSHKLVVEEGWSYGLVSTFAADLGHTVMYSSLLRGGALHLLPTDETMDGEHFGRYCRERSIDCVKITPTHFQALLGEEGGEERIPAKCLVFGGEALWPELVSRVKSLRPGCRIFNHYGPTECTVGALSDEVVKEEEGTGRGAVALGRPLTNMRVYVLDGNGAPAPVGVVGELYIGGAGVARGYLNRAEVTAERFVSDPFAVDGPDGPERMYKTGDLGRWKADGTIEFVGRNDFQVKLRGYRVELGEIEASLREHAGVGEAVVLAREDTNGDKQLVAYVTPEKAAAYPLWQGLRMERSGELEPGTRYELPNGMLISHQNKGETDFVYEEIFGREGYMQHGIRLSEDACVMDVGANIGLFTLYVLEQAPAASIYAFEPIPPVYENLRINTTLSGGNVRLFNCGVSNTTGSASFAWYKHDSLISGRYADVEEEKAIIKAFIKNQKTDEEVSEETLERLIEERLEYEEYTCPLRAISEIIAAEGIERIDLLKIDVQKSEMEVLEGIAAEDWKKIRQIVVEVHDIEGRLSRIQALLTGQGFLQQVEQDQLLEATNQYTVYARRASKEDVISPGKSARSARYWSREQLTGSLREHVSAKLPEYMVPGAYVCLEKLPLTANGKLDRKALPAPETETYRARDYDEPVGEIERAVAEIWADVLKVERVGRHDNFFELGGHSLLVIRVLSRLRRTLNLEVTIGVVFEHPVLADLAAAVQQATPDTLPPIEAAQRVGPLPLSFAQQRLWFLAQMGASEAYHIFKGWRLKGQLDREALRRGWDRIVARHEALRTTFIAVEGEPVQHIAAAHESQFHLVEHDLIGASDVETELNRLVRAEVRAEFDLEAGPLIRGRLIRLGEEQHALLITMHHIVSDGWSMDVFIRELSALYEAFLRGEEDPLPDLGVQYADYAVWQREWIEGEILRQQGEYWQRALEGAPTLLELPTDYPRPVEQQYAGGWIRVDLDEELTRKLKELSQRASTTLYMTLLTGWTTLLARLSGQEDIVIGAPVANRGRMEIEGLIGFFVNTLALRLDVSGSPSVRELLERVKEQTLAAQQHQDIPFEQVVEVARPARSLSHSPLFQVMFDWQQNAGSGGGLAMAGLELGPLGVATDAVAQFDLSLALQDAGERIVGSLVYATSLYERATVERYVGYLRTLLEGMVEDDSNAADRLLLLPEAERQQVLYEWNATEAEYPRERSVHELFEAQVEKTPDAVAVVVEDATLSYRELNRRANQLAHYLRELGVGPDQRVAICMDRSLEMMVGLLGVLKAGGAYVPLDPTYPVERLRYMVEDSEPAVMLTEGRWQELFPGLDEKLPVVEMDQAAPSWSKQAESNPPWTTSGSGSHDLAYVIYTSGTTGTPKGVMVEQRGMVNHLFAKIRDLQLSGRDVVAQTASQCFDISVWQFFAALVVGGQVQIVGQQEVHDPEGLLRVLDHTGVTVWETVPSLLEAMVGDESEGSEKLAGLRWLVVTGEACPVGLCRRWRSLYPAIAMMNAYGPTECSDDVTHYLIGPGWTGEELRQLPIGRPLMNTEVYVLDGEGEPAPVGVRGELYIGGEGVGRGYWKRPELTGDRFVADRFGRRAGARLYRTGDVGRWQADGTLEFLGRIDHQVKIRGYRIELGEIEARLIEHEAVQEAVVIEREDTAGDKRLVAYYSSAESNGAGIGAEELRRHLAATLPEYMTPAAYVRMEKLPLTPNGKVDRKALPAPETDAYWLREYEEPQGEAERALAEIWADVLKVDRVGRHDNFFELGGHSLLVVRVIARLRQVGLDVDVRTLFVTPVLAQLAAALGRSINVVEVPPNPILELGKHRDNPNTIEIRL